MVITSSKVVDLSDWDSDVIKVLAIGGGGGRVRLPFYILPMHF